MFAPNEVVTLALAALSAPFLFVLARDLRKPSLRAFAAGFAMVLVSLLATNLESVFLPDALNAVEHLALAAAGPLFAAGALMLRREASGGGPWT